MIGPQTDAAGCDDCGGSTMEDTAAAQQGLQLQHCFFWFVDDASDDRRPPDRRNGHSLAAMAAEDRRDTTAAQQVSIDVFLMLRSCVVSAAVSNDVFFLGVHWLFSRSCVVSTSILCGLRSQVLRWMAWGRGEKPGFPHPIMAIQFIEGVFVSP